MMKQFAKLMKKCLSVLWAFLTVSIFFSCNIGMGETVDTEAPSVSITVPDPSSVLVIREDFPVKGNWDDDGKLSSITVELKSEENVVFSKEAEFNGKVGDSEKCYSVIVSPKNDVIPDGSYIIVVTAKDNAGHSSSTTSSIVVDNTSPFVVISRPSTSLDSEIADSYGQTFSLAGSAADDNNISLIELNVYSDANCTNKLHTVNLTNVPNSINLEVAQFEAGKDNDYSKIYGSSDINAGEKTFYFSLMAYDSAIRIPTDGSAQTTEDLKGNATDLYYLNDTVSDLIRNYKISGLYHMKNGTFVASDASKTAEISESVNTTLASKQLTAGKFTLNPANNPTFTMADTYVPDTESETPVWASVLNNASSTITVSPGLDGYAIVKDSLKVYALKCDAKGNILDETKIYPSFTGPEASGSSYKLTPSFIKSEGFKFDQYYKIFLEGKDESGNAIIPADDAYGFRFTKTGIAPTIRIATPADSTSYVAKGQSVTVSGTVEFKEDTGAFSISLNDGQNDTVLASATAGNTVAADSSLKEGVLSYIQDSQNELLYTFKYIIPSSNFNQETSSQYSVKVTADKAYSTKDIKYDVDMPLISVASVTPVAVDYKLDSQGYILNEASPETNAATTAGFVNGSITFTIKASETYDQLSSCSVTVNGSPLELSSAVQTGAKNFAAFAPIDTTKYQDGSALTLKISVKDRAGNETVQTQTYTVKQSTDIPVVFPKDNSTISFINMKTSEAVLNQGDTKKNLFDIENGGTLNFDIRDDDNGQCKLFLTIDDDSENTLILTPNISGGKASAYHSISDLETGVHKISLSVQDVTGKKRENIVFYIRIVPGAPSVEISEFDANPYKSSNQALTAKIAITSEEKPFRITRQIKKGNEIKEDFKTFIELGSDSAVNGTKAEGETAYKYDYEIPSSSLDGLAEGEYTVKYRIYDSNGLYGETETQNFYLDRTAPVVEKITTPVQTSEVNNPFDFEITLVSQDTYCSPETYYFAFTDSDAAQPAEAQFVKATSKTKYNQKYASDANFASVFIDVTEDETGAVTKTIREGKKKVWYYVEDKAGNKTAVNSKTFFYDLEAPGATLSLSQGYSAATNQRYNINFTASDSWGVEKAELYENDVLIGTYTEDSNKNGIEITGLPKNLPEGKTFENQNLSEKYTYKLKVTDKAGRTTVPNLLSVEVDTIKPVIQVSDKSVLKGNMDSLTGTVTDAGILKVSTLCYAITQVTTTEVEPAVAPTADKFVSVQHSDESWSVVQYLGTGSGESVMDSCLYEGAHCLWVYAIDSAGNESEKKHVHFYVDQAEPKIDDSAKIMIGTSAAETDIQADSTLYLNLTNVITDTLTISGTITETNGLKDPENGGLSVKVGDTHLSASNITVTRNAETKVYSYTISGIQISQSDKEIPVVITSKDLAEQTSDKTFIFYDDKTVPEIQYIDPASDITYIGTNAVKGNSKTFRISLADAASGLSAFKYAITQSATKPADGSSEWITASGISGKSYAFSVSKDLDTGSSITTSGHLCEGHWYLYTEAEDSKGNKSSGVKDFWIDQSAPALSIKDIQATGQVLNGAPTRNAGFDLDITASDANGLEKVVITSTSFTDEHSVTITNGAGTQHFTVGNETEAGQKLTDGTHTLTVTATDKAGRTSTSSINVFVDSSKPAGTSTPETRVFESTDGKKWYNNRYISVTVSSLSDGDGSGIYQVLATADDISTETAAATASWTPLTPKTSNNVTTYEGKVECRSQGANTITVRIYDNAGNYTDKTHTVYVDTEEPSSASISSVTVGSNSESTSGTVLVNGTMAMDIVIAAADSGSGIKNVKLTKVGSVSKDITAGIDAGKYIATIPAGGFASGNVFFSIEDYVGNKSEYSSDLIIDLDNVYPEVKLDSITDADSFTTDIDVNKTITITGKASDNNALASVQLQYRISKSTTFSGDWLNYREVTGTSATLATWSVPVDTTDTDAFPADKPYVQFRAVGIDTAQNTGNIGRALTSGENETVAVQSSDAIKTVYINQATDIPVITFTELPLNSPATDEELCDFSKMSASSPVKLNKKEIRGNVKDDDGVIKELSYSKNNGTSWEPVTLSGVTFTIELEDDTYNLAFKIKDAGNGEFDTSTDSSAIILKDKKDHAATAGKLNIIVDKTPPEVVNVNMKRAGTTTSTETEIVNEYTFNSSNFSKTYGGDDAHNKFQMQLMAWDKNGIDKASFTISDMSKKDVTPTGSGSYTKTKSGDASNKYDIFETASVDISSLSTGQYTITIKVLDGGGSEKSVTKSIYIDNSAPVIKVSSHSDNQQEGQDFVMQGDFDDGDSKTILYYQVTNTAGTPEDSDTNWKEAAGTSSISWKIYFDSTDTSVTDEGSDGYSHYLHPKYIVAALNPDTVEIVNNTAVLKSDKTKKYTTVGTYYFHLKVTDEFGNIGKKTIPIKLDPQGDIPTIVLDYPLAEDYVYYNSTSKTWAVSTVKADSHPTEGTSYKYVGPSALMSGIIRASGSAEFVNDVQGLYMQIDPTFEPDKGFSASWNEDPLTGASSTLASIGNDKYEIKDFGEGTGAKKGISLGTSLSWSKSINTTSEFEIKTSNSTDDSTNYIAIRLYAYDKSGNTSVTDDDIFIVRINSGAPKIGSSVPLKLKQYSNMSNGSGVVTAIMDYTDGMYIRGEWYLEGSVEDENGISICRVGTDDYATGSQQTWGSGTTATSGYMIKHKVGSSSETGKFTYEIYAVDGTPGTDEENRPKTTKTITINCDNRAPQLASAGDDDYDISDNVENSNGFFKVKSAATESSGESGFRMAVFYFKHSNGNVYDSYIKKDTDGNAIAYGGTSPSITLGTDNLYWKTGTVAANGIDGNKVTITASDANLHKGGLVKLGGVFYIIKSVNGTLIELDDSPDTELAGKPIYFAIGHVVDHVGSESRGKVTETTANDGYGYYKDLSTNDDDGDRMIESVSTVGTKTRWSGEINSRNIPDGKVEIHYVVFDKAGNAAHEKVDAVVMNNAPRLASLKVWTDYNGNGNEDDGEYKTSYYSEKTRRITENGNTKSVKRATALTKDLVVTGTDENGDMNDTAFMIVKGDVKFTPEIVGGNEELFYSYKVASTKTGLTSATATAGSSLGAPTKDYTVETGDSGYVKSDKDGQSYIDGQKVEITLAGNKLGTNSTEAAPTWFEYTIWDKTPGTIVNSEDEDVSTWTSLNAKFRVALAVQYADTVAPKVAISPFFWKGVSKNSLYHNSKENGHIELEADLTDEIKNIEVDSTKLGEDPKVSGKITVRGYVYDDILLQKVLVKIPGFTPGNETFSNYVEVATYSSGNWVVIDGYEDDEAGNVMNSKHWTFKISDEYNEGKGHKANFEFSWDTSYITGVAAKDVQVYVQAVGARGGASYNISSETAVLTNESEGVYNKPVYQMDVVPYITGLTTSLSSLKPTNPSVFSRTALGHYPVYKGEKIKINGFNLKKDNESIDSVELPAGTNSGNYNYTTNSIPALNNYNTKDAHGSYGYDTSTIVTQGNKDVYDNFYNRWPNGANNNNLTDDVILDVWEFDASAVRPVKGHIDQPIMKINPEDGNIGFAFADGALYYSMGGKVTDNNVTTNYSYNYWMGAYDSFTSVAFAYDNLGYTYGIGAGGDINDSSNSNQGSMDNMSLMSSRWGIGGRSNQASKNGLTDNGNFKNHIRMDKIGQYLDGSLIVNKQRVQSPSLAATVQSDEKTTNLYLAYYDAINDEIRFRSGSTSITTHNSIPEFGNFTTINGNAPEYYDKANEKNSDDTTQCSLNNVSLVAGGTSQTGKKAGKYVSIAVIPDAAHGTADTVVIVWFDEKNRTLWYAYNLSPLSSSTGINSGSEWHVFRVFPETATYKNAGENCQIAVDANGHVHIAAYDQNKCDLLYAYTSTPTAENPGFKTCIVDSDGVVGSNISLDVALKEENGQAIPRIGYYAASCVKPKYAWLVSESTDAPAGAVSDSFTGAWECTVVPTTNSLIIDNSKQTNLINVGVWKDKATGVIKDSTTGDKAQNNTFNKYASTNNGLLYGNGTKNAVLGYVIALDAANDRIETAQMR